MNKPRVRFCWECGRKLYGNHHAIYKGLDGLERIVHKSCLSECKKQELDRASRYSVAAARTKIFDKGYKPEGKEVV
jgi:hypothetical protein